MMMTLKTWVAAGAVLFSGMLVAQAPAGSTGQCKDGTYTSTQTKKGACRGHKGIQAWYAADAPATASTPVPAATPAPAAAAAPVTKSVPAATPATTRASASNKVAAPGGGPGLVWVNTSTKVYHCYGKPYYGTTKDGKYMSEADAKSSGARPDHNIPCSK